MRTLPPLLQDALFAAVELPNRDECLAAIQAALDAGADVNARESRGGFSALHFAAFNRDAAAVKAAVQALVAAGADVRAKAIDGREPLDCVPLNRNAEAAAAAVQSLVAAGQMCGPRELMA